jgi:hypothetical protein
MGEGIEGINGQATREGSASASDAISSETVSIVERVADTRPAASAAQGTGTSASAEKRKHNRKNREIPVLITPVETVPAPAAADAEKPVRKRAVKADPVITAAIIAIAGSGMMTAGKMLNEEKLWTPTTSELTSVAEPAARIIERLNATATVSKYADYIALGVAVATIIIPRVLASNMKKSKGGTKPHAAKKGTSPYPAAADTKTTPIPAAGDAAGKEILEEYPANVPADIGISQINLGYDESI